VLTFAACPSCEAPNATGQRYCGQCGFPLEDVPSRMSGSHLEERKLVTVLFADVVGFTSLAERTDPEIVARMVDAAFRQLGEAVAAHGGRVDKFMGDSVMAVFGVPVAHDDDAERAVAAALAMRDLGGDLAFSIGVNSGEVMATAVGRAGDATVIGDTVNVAARLERLPAQARFCAGVSPSSWHAAGFASASASPSSSRGSASPSRHGSPNASARPIPSGWWRARGWWVGKTSWGSWWRSGGGP